MTVDRPTDDKYWTDARRPYRGYGYVPLRFGGNVVRRMGTQQQQDGGFIVFYRDSNGPPY